MMNFWKSCALILSLISLFNIGRCEWDYLLFTQQWPPTVCQQWKEESPKHECIEWKELTWTAHGIWPSNISGEDPSFCNPSLKFDVSLIQSLISSLETYWPNMYKGTADESFWAHEWNKHGTCATSDAKIPDEFAYFHSGIQLVKKFNLYQYLSEHGITPSSTNEITLSDIKTSIKTHLGVAPLVQCYKDNVSKKFLIQEIRLCLDKSLEIMECPPHVKHDLQYTMTCPEKGTLVYPPLHETAAWPRKALLWLWYSNLHLPHFTLPSI